MRNKQLITRIRDSERKNVWRISLTEKGHQVYFHALERASIRDPLSNLPDDELGALELSLRKLLDEALGLSSKSREHLHTAYTIVTSSS